MEGITDDELLDRFTRGLRPNVRAQVLIANPGSFEEACIAAERVGLVLGEMPQFGFGGGRGFAGAY